MLFSLVLIPASSRVIGSSVSLEISHGLFNFFLNLADVGSTHCKAQPTSIESTRIYNNFIASHWFFRQCSNFNTPHWFLCPLQLRARILHINKSTKRIGLTAAPHLVKKAPALEFAGVWG